MVGMAVGIAGGIFLNLIRAEKMLQPFALKADQTAKLLDKQETDKPPLSFRGRRGFAKRELLDILSRV